MSVDNRRLDAMKEAQRRMRERDPTKVVYVRVQLYSWAPVFFVNHLDVQLRHPQLPRAGKPRES